MYMLFPGGLYKALTLSYDDGVVYDKTLMDIMKKHGLKGTFNLNSGLFAPTEGQRRFTADEVRRYYDDPSFEVAVHGLLHRFPCECAPGVLTQEILNDRENLEKMFGRIVRGMAYAYGNYNDDVVETLRLCGISYARTTKATHNFDIPTDWLRMPATCHHRDELLPSLTERFLDTQEDIPLWRRRPQLFYVWGHSYEFNDSGNWYIIENFAEKVGGKDYIWYATNGEIHDYVEAYRSLVVSCDETIVYNPTSQPIWFFEKKTFVIAPGETLTIG